MELTVNTFNKGLQTDTHPMVQGTDTLSDALNATFVTMNGNEVILQNDMGNRRVDNAYLPAGYEPVGIKEYGGIIYIAAYNPITNRSLIGSFPSPERKIGILDDGDLGGSFFETEMLEYYEESNLYNLVCLLNDSVQVPITGKNSLHAGDKFVIYSNDLDTIKDNLSNYNNVINNKVYSPKNKKYTISIGILNSLNEFVDITKTLGRYKNSTANTPYSFNNNESDLYKFNFGYFICLGFDNSRMTETINDANFINERNKIATNTYSYKLIGPMYMLVKLNHIENFNYNIYGTYDKDNRSAKLQVEGIATYNCPDLITNFTLADSDIYYTYLTGETLDFMFDFFQYRNGFSQQAGEKVNINDSKTTYDPTTNLYTAKYVKEYEFSGLEDSIFNYVIGVKSGLKLEGHDLYLAGLSDKGMIDLNLLGSGTILLNGWRFYNKDKITTLTYSIQAYPKYGETLEYLELYLKDVSNNSNNSIVISELPIGNGRQTVQIDWGKEYKCGNETVTLKEKTLYQVTFGYKLAGSNTIISISKDNIEEFLLTTELFNSCYSLKSSNKDYIANYGYPGGIHCSEITVNYNSDNSEIKTFIDKITIAPSIDFILLDESDPIIGKLEGSKVLPASEFTSENYAKQVIYTQLKELNYELRGTIKAPENYPSYIQFSSLKSNNILITNVSSNIEDVKEQLSEIVDNPDNYISEENLTSLGNKIKGTIKWKDIYSAPYKQYKGKIRNGFDSVLNYLDDILTFDSNGRSDYVSFSGILLDCGGHGGGGGDNHWITFVYDYSKNKFTELATELPDADVTTLLYWKNDISEDDHKKDARNLFKTSNPTFDLLSYFGRISPEKVFAYIFDATKPVYTKDLGRLLMRSIPSDKEFDDCKINLNNTVHSMLRNRVWWRTTDNTWAVIDLTFGFDNSILDITGDGEMFDGTNPYHREPAPPILNDTMASLIKALFPEKLYFCRYKTFNSNGELYVAEYQNLEYNEPYEYDYNVKLNFNIAGENIVNIGHPSLELLHFSPLASNLSSDELTLFKVKSSTDFYDYVSGSVDMLNIDIHTGVNIDTNGKRLSSSDIYYENPNELNNYRLVINPKMRADFSGTSDLNALVCVAEHDQPLTDYPVNFAGSLESDKGDEWTWLYFDKVERLSPNNLKNITT